MVGFGGHAHKILKPATEITGIKVSRVQCDKEITLPKRVRNVDKTEIDQMRSRESPLCSSVDSLNFFLVRTRVIFLILMSIFKGYSIPDR